jgi:C4-dicarboxylate-specific signal transduction histidine kinase
VKRIRGLVKKAPPQPTSQDLNDLMGEVLLLVNDALTQRQVTTHVQLTNDVPPVMGDRVQLQQVMLNLVMNGIEAMNEVTDRPRQLVVSSRRLDNGQVALRVTDSGVGVDPAVAEKLFDPFFTTKDGGMGIGLSISRSIVESYGGHLWASPNEGPGATFHVALPAIQ